MNKKTIQAIKTKLLEQLKNLEQNENSTKKEIVVKDSFADLTDRASYETDQNFELRIRERERILSNKIKIALAKIDEGNYGICESCGEEISEKRLLARPVTDLCINCKTSKEHEEKQYED